MATADFTIAGFLAWVRTKPADEMFRYSEPRRCAIAQFAQHLGADLMDEQRWHLERELCEVILCTPYYDGSRKFGDLVKALEALVPAKPISDTWTKANAYLTDIEQVDA